MRSRATALMGEVRARVAFVVDPFHADVTIVESFAVLVCLTFPEVKAASAIVGGSIRRWTAAISRVNTSVARFDTAVRAADAIRACIAGSGGVCQRRSTHAVFLTRNAIGQYMVFGYTFDTDEAIGVALFLRGTESENTRYPRIARFRSIEARELWRIASQGRQQGQHRPTKFTHDCVVAARQFSRKPEASVPARRAANHVRRAGHCGVIASVVRGWVVRLARPNAAREASAVETASVLRSKYT